MFFKSSPTADDCYNEVKIQNLQRKIEDLKRRTTTPISKDPSSLFPSPKRETLKQQKVRLVELEKELEIELAKKPQYDGTADPPLYTATDVPQKKGKVSSPTAENDGLPKKKSIFKVCMACCFAVGASVALS
jgi:hypothetical protein